MTAEQINRKLAEWMGWTDIKVGKLYTWELYGKSPDPIIDRTRVPDYHASLDAVHEIEMRLDDPAFGGTLSRYDQYADYLSRRFGRSIRATALQRCEAILRTLNLWEEAP